ncbi:MAG: hypothetical protein EU541_01000 [Promethearchaeota archaeon]|nr:MAG: hypothetical protein EU541_01000 [Candidatus Lokiarchaeota archaeon]
MNLNKIGNILAVFSAIIVFFLAIFGIMISIILANIGLEEIEPVANAARPFFIVYFAFSVIAILLAVLNFLIKKERILAVLNIILYALILIFTIIITFLNMPLIIEIGEDLPIFAFASTFTVFLIASVLGIVAGILKIFRGQ